MKMRLKIQNQVPYGGSYVINRPDLGIVGSGTTWQMLLNNVEDYRRANSIPIGIGFYDELEAVVCQQYSAECESTEPAFVRPRELTLGEIVTGSRIMLSQWIHGRKVVDRAEAERRAQICVTCPMNLRFRKSCNGLCPELSQVVSAITGAQGTQYDVNLHSCNVCGCYISAAIWVPLSDQINPLPEKIKERFKLIPNCWKVLPSDAPSSD